MVNSHLRMSFKSVSRWRTSKFASLSRPASSSEADSTVRLRRRAGPEVVTGLMTTCSPMHFPAGWATAAWPEAAWLWAVSTGSMRRVWLRMGDMLICLGENRPRRWRFFDVGAELYFSRVRAKRGYGDLARSNIDG